MTDYFDLTGQVAVVTGASAGLGAQFAKTLAARGADVAVLARRTDMLKALAEEITLESGRRCRYYTCDVGQEASIEEAVSAILTDFTKIDILVNNAGIVKYSRDFPSHTTEKWNTVLSVDLTGAFLFSRYTAQRSMIPNGYGRIINLTSVAAIQGGLGTASYSAAKGGILSLTKAMAADLAPYGITVNAIGPGNVESEMSAKTMDNPFVKEMIAKTPMKRFGRAEELSGILLAFASPVSSYTTGQVVYVDGGMTSVL